MATLDGGIVVVDREGWVLAVESADEAIMKIEAPDVEAGEYLIFDSGGRVIEPYVESLGKSSWWRRIRTQPAIGFRATELRHPELLAQILSEALGKELATSDPLEQLVSKAVFAKRFSLRSPDAVALPGAQSLRHKLYDLTGFEKT